jgi:hypothetical protein
MWIVLRGVSVPNANKIGQIRNKDKERKGGMKEKIGEGWMDHPCD